MLSLKNRISILASLFLILLSMVLNSCSSTDHEVTQIKARPESPTVYIKPGEHPLGLGGWRLVNRSVIWRDGTLYIPQSTSHTSPLPLLVWLHGGGGKSDSYRYLYPIAEELGIVILALDARHNTWDGIDSPFGPDVLFIDKALQYTFERVSIDPSRIVLGGLSDGASYALALGRTNGNLFTHLMGVAPGLLNPPAPPVGNPKILLAHGTRDNVYWVQGTRYYIYPKLKNAGYDVTYIEFDGPHSMPPAIARQALLWLLK